MKEALRAEATHTQHLREVQAHPAEVAVHIPHLRGVLQAAALILHQAEVQVAHQWVLLLWVPVEVLRQDHLVVEAVAAEVADVAAVAVDVVN